MLTSFVVVTLTITDNDQYKDRYSISYNCDLFKSVRSDVDI